MLPLSKAYQHLLTSLASVDHLAADGKISLEHVLSLGVLSASGVQHPEIAARRLLVERSHVGGP